MEQLAELRQSTGAVRCLACGKCTTVCPLCQDGRFSARVLAAHDVADLEGEHAELAGRCLTCGRCETYCPQGIHFTSYVRGLRAMTPACVPPEPHGAVFSCMARSMAQRDEVRRELDWLPPDLQIAEEGDIGYFVGCLPLFEAYFGESLDIRPLEIARSAIRLLNQLDIKPVVMAEERCCGHDLLWTGDRDGFTALATANTDAFAKRGVKEIITTCAECCRTWRVDYAEAVPGYNPKVTHLAEFLAPRIDSGELQLDGAEAEKVTFQDPCRLASHLGVTDAPRQTLAGLPGAEVVEMPRSGKSAMCCGTSGFIHCDATSRRLQTGRLNEAAGTGAETMVTACPKCLIHFACAQAEDRRRQGKEPSIAIKDLAVLTASRLPSNGAGKTDDTADERRKAGVAR